MPRIVKNPPDPDSIIAMLADGMTHRDIAKATGLSRSYVQRMMRDHRAQRCEQVTRRSGRDPLPVGAGGLQDMSGE